jgi:hypothetical protein
MGVLQVFSPFYVRTSGGAPKPGDIYWTPIPDVQEVPRIFDVERSDSAGHTRIEGRIVDVGSHHFRKRERLPVKLLSLGSTEEMLITKAKCRPSVVLFQAGVGDAKGLGPQDARLAKGVTKPSYVVAPLYSVGSADEPGTFMPTLVARIRALRYPHLSCLPRIGSNHPVPGEIVRLDRIHVTHLGKGSASDQLALHDDITALLVGQLQWAACGVISDFLQATIETVADCLPEELR